MAIIRPLSSTAPGHNLRAVTPHATDDLPDGTCRALYVGGAGDLTVLAAGDDAAVTFVGVAAGSTITVACKAVRASSTATDIVAIY